jgi:ABC-type multidrug transport system permease subunit
LFWLIIFLVQLSKKNIGNTKILQMQDFRTNGVLGDLIALSILDFVIGATIFASQLKIISVIISIIVASVSVRVFYLYFTQTKRKVPDWGWYQKENLKWVSTLGGKLHICYFFVQTFFISLFVLNPFTYHIPTWLLSLTILGFLLYGIAFLLDQKKFRSLF